MTTVVDWHKVSGDSVTQSLQQARDNLNGAEGEVLLDFEAVRRIDPSGLRAVEALADTADQKSVKVALRGVNVAVYKVLKLARLSPRFVFVS